MNVIILAGIVLGAVIGALSARRRKGNRLDMLQYGAVMALVFGVAGALVSVLLLRLG